jgi:serine protease Do
MSNMRKFWFLAGLFCVIAAAGILAPALLQRNSVAASKPASMTVDRAELARLAAAEPMSKLFRAVAQAMRPAVVEVRVKKRVAAPTFNGMDPDEFFRRFFDDEPSGPLAPRRSPRAPAPDQEQFQIQRGLGSGVIVDAPNGYVLTNYHVVGGADQVEVILADERHFTVEKIWNDPPTDLSVVKIKADNLVAAPLGDSSQMEVGDMVLAFGAPEGLAQTVTTGIISAKGRTTGGRNYEDFIQTDAAINHGNSGGPLVNMRGEVIGINAAIISRTGVNEGIGFAISSNMAKTVLEQLLKSGKVTRGYLGVNIQDVDERLARSFNLPSTKGALVTRAMKDSPADKAGLKAGDFITAVNDKPIADSNGLRNEVATFAPGAKVKLTFLREGTQQTVEATVAGQPADMFAKTPGEGGAETPTTRKYGLTVDTMNDRYAQQLGYKAGAHGVIITKIEPTSDASEAGLLPGMVIDQVNGKDVGSVDDWNAAVTSAKGELTLRVEMPDGGVRYVVISGG